VNPRTFVNLVVAAAPIGSCGNGVTYGIPHVDSHLRPRLIADYADLVVMPTCRLDRRRGKGICVNGSAWSEPVEEGQQRVGWPIAARRGLGRIHAGDGAFLLRHVGVQVDRCGGDLLVAEPEGDDRDVDAGLQQPHRGGMSQGVHGDVLAAQQRAGEAGDREVPGEAVLDGVTAEPGPGPGGEQGVVRGTGGVR
jgi:hypothetical protein